MQVIRETTLFGKSYIWVTRNGKLALLPAWDGSNTDDQLKSMADVVEGYRMRYTLNDNQETLEVLQEMTNE